MGIAEVLMDLGEGIGALFVSVLNKLATIFFTIGEGGAFSMTPLGYLALIGLVLTIVYRLFNYVRSIIRGRA